LDPRETEANLDAMIAEVTEAGLPVLLAGMRAPPNLGPEYGAEFDGLFPRLAAKHDVVFYPFFLDGVAAVPNLNQDDGIHPTGEGVAEIVRRMLPAIEKLIARVK
ncbi:MAG: arylesterase, partial [Rhodospirillaceae bacterium]